MTDRTNEQVEKGAVEIDQARFQMLVQDVRVGRFQKLRDFDLSDPAVKQKMKERYGNKVPLDETVISPGEMFSSPELKVVAEE